MSDGRKRIARVVATLCVTAVGGSLVAAAPTAAKPDIPSVQSRVDRLYRQAEQASERYNNARLRLHAAQTRMRSIESDLHRQQARVDTVREQVATAVIDQYQGQGLSSTAQVLLAENPDSFLDQLTTVSAFNDQRTQLMAGYVVAVKRLEVRQAEARRELGRIAETKTQLGTEKRHIDEKAAQAKELLTRLKERAAAARASRAAARQAAAERAAASRSTGSAGSTTGASSAGAATGSAAAPSQAAPASGRAAAAVRYALAQVGDAYVWGAAGPSAFDCSGLMMAAWAQAGVGLPHSSSAQMSSGTPVSQSQLQPGDLVFYYSPVSHVGMYIGNGQIVNAENPSVGVKITGVNSMPYAGAVRPG